MTEFYFIRHGESELNILPHIVGGRSNHAQLTPLGEQQGTDHGHKVIAAGIKPDVVVTSPAVRTIGTMERSMHIVGISYKAIIEPRFQELAQGVEEGAIRSETYPQEVLDEIARQDIDFKFENGESIREVTERMVDGLDDYAEQFPSATIFVYGHGFSIRCLAGYIDGRSREEILSLETGNTSNTRISVTNGARRVHYVGEPDFLRESV